MTEKEFFKLPFRDMVADVAGRALLELVRGVKWESIFHTVATEICHWRMNQPDIKLEKR